MASTPAEFDPYAEWLRLPPGSRPPDHYMLLGLKRFEGSPADIENRAHKQLARLDRYALTPNPQRRALCQTLMNQVAQARVTLSDAEKRRSYDAQLKGERTPVKARPDVKIGAPRQRPSPPGASFSPSALLPRRRNRWLIPLAVGLTALLLTLLVMLWSRAPLPVPATQIAVTQPTPPASMPATQIAANPARPPASTPSGFGRLNPAPPATRQTRGPAPGLAVAAAPLTLQLPPAPRLPAPRKLDARAMLRFAAEHAGTNPGSTHQLLQLAAAQIAQEDIPGAVISLNRMEEIDKSLASLVTQERAWKIILAVRAGQLDSARTQYKSLVSGIAQGGTGNPVDDYSYVVAQAAALLDDPATVEAQMARGAQAQTHNYTSSMPVVPLGAYNVQAARLLAGHDRTAALALLKNHPDAGVRTSVKGLMSSEPVNYADFISGTDFLRFLPIALQISLDQLAAGDAAEAAGILAANADSTPRPAVNGPPPQVAPLYTLTFRCLIKLQRNADLTALADELGRQKDDIDVPMQAACELATSGDFGSALKVINASPATAEGRNTAVIRLAETLAAAGQIAPARDLLRQQNGAIQIQSRFLRTTSPSIPLAATQISLGDAEGAKATLANNPARTNAQTAILNRDAIGCWARLGESASALETARPPPVSPAVFAQSSAPVLASAGDYASALKALTDFMPPYSNSANAQFRQACETFACCGDYEHALQYSRQLPEKELETFQIACLRAFLNNGDVQRAVDFVKANNTDTLNIKFKGAFFNGGWSLLNKPVPTEPQRGRGASVFPNADLRRAWSNEVTFGAPDAVFQRMTAFWETCDAALAVAAARRPSALVPCDYSDPGPPPLNQPNFLPPPLYDTPPYAQFALCGRNLDVTLFVDRQAVITLDHGNLILSATTSGLAAGDPDNDALPTFVNASAWYPIWKNEPGRGLSTLPVNILAAHHGWTLGSVQPLDPGVSATTLAAKASAAAADGKPFTVTVTNSHPNHQWIRVQITNAQRTEYLNAPSTPPATSTPGRSR